MRIALLAVLLLLSFSCAVPEGGRPMKTFDEDGRECPDFSSWREILSPFEGERCFAFDESDYRNGVVCKRADSVYFKKCADPKARPNPVKVEPQ